MPGRLFFFSACGNLCHTAADFCLVSRMECYNHIYDYVLSRTQDTCSVTKFKFLIIKLSYIAIFIHN